MNVWRPGKKGRNKCTAATSKLFILFCFSLLEFCCMIYKYPVFFNFYEYTPQGFSVEPHSSVLLSGWVLNTTSSGSKEPLAIQRTPEKPCESYSMPSKWHAHTHTPLLFGYLTICLDLSLFLNFSQCIFFVFQNVATIRVHCTACCSCVVTYMTNRILNLKSWTHPRTHTTEPIFPHSLLWLRPLIQNW